MNAVGIFGGTFDPVHIGHLRSCVELREYLGLEQVHLLPNARPPHRQAPEVTAEHRLAMLNLAIAEEPGLVADDRELRRDGLSYTLDTLQALRQELGSDTSLSLCIGMDSLVNLASWHRWQELADFAHLVVVARPGWQTPESGPVAEWLSNKLLGDAACLKAEPSGRVLVREMTLLPISSTQVRSDLAAGRSVRYLVPDPVLDYIHQHHLYLGK
ncbi:MAG: nicotinate-nucleotide adenylyltransferase [Porticoccaceae bacterium]|nr:nicotinate-nucleotide adenylyltransferase [Porticoccaceae bacterium]